MIDLRSLLVACASTSLAGLALTACDGGPDGVEGGDGTTRETVDGVEWVRSTGPGIWGRDTLAAQVEHSLGEMEGRAEYLFGDLTALAFDGAGRLYVADRIGSALRAYSADGRHLATLATEGEGPGELMWPTGLNFGPDGSLYVRDRARVTRFSLAEDGRSATAEETLPAPGFAPATTRRSRLTTGGAYLYPHERHPHGAPSQHFYVASGETSEPDTLRVPHYAGFAQRTPFIRTGTGGGRMVSDLMHVAFAPLPSWDLTHRGTVLSTDGDGYRVVETDAAGDTVRVIEREERVRTIPERVRRDSLRAVESRIADLPVPLAQVEEISEEVRQRRIPEHYPAVKGLFVGEEERIWVKRWPPGGRDAETFYDVFAAEGDFLGTIRLPVRIEASPPPWFERSRIAGVVIDPEFDVQRVVTLSFDAPEGS